MAGNNSSSSSSSDNSNYERRRHRRYQVQDVQGSLLLQTDVSILNMSLTGLAIESQRSLRVGDQYALRLQYEGEQIEVPAEVQWSHLVRTERAGKGEVVPIYQAGLDYREALDDKARDLLGFLQRHIVVQLERRVSGRFEIDVEDSAGLSRHVDFVVRQISYSGMRIETDYLLEEGAVFDVEVQVGKRLLLARGRVANSRQFGSEPGKPMYEAGIAFEPMPQQSRSALEAAIKDLLE